MQRELAKQLIKWKNAKSHLPILLRGARQVGKTYLVESFGQANFSQCHTINFELQPQAKTCFADLSPEAILRELELLLGQPIRPGEDLLFLDEIQECPQAIMALRYFKEQCPALHIIGAGSLLEFALRQENFRMPVGRVQFYYLKPLSFEEFLQAQDNPALLKQLKSISLDAPPTPLAHEKLLQALQTYCVVGGMPAVCNTYFEEASFLSVQKMQTLILSTYQRDFGKYADTGFHKFLETVFVQSPNLIGKQVKYVDLAENMRSRDLKEAITMLEQAGVIHRVFSTAASGIPLNATVNPKKFKFVSLDIGLANRSTNVDIKTMLDNTTHSLTKGHFTEQFVGQELIAHTPFYEEPRLFYWTRDKTGSMAELDYVYQYNNHIIPIEVKSGSTGRLKSLKQFMQTHQSPLGIQLCRQNLKFENNILTLPLYLAGELRRILGVMGVG